MGLTTPYAIEIDDEQDQKSRRPKKVRVLMPGPDFREMNKRNIGCPKEEKSFVPLREGKEFLEKRREENERRRMVGKAEIHGKTTEKGVDIAKIVEHAFVTTRANIKEVKKRPLFGGGGIGRAGRETRASLGHATSAQTKRALLASSDDATTPRHQFKLTKFLKVPSKIVTTW
ncbi:unnamed protein product [Bathycoccus prasinos]|tara:strand:+ start:258 stop:776 length:519 start_codon:yes stop_codon:yes gene_type:complete